jgi:hypothetical protein
MHITHRDCNVAQQKDTGREGLNLAPTLDGKSSIVRVLLVSTNKVRQGSFIRQTESL